MAGGSDWEGQNKLLSGLFGSFQQAASNFAGTSDLWTQLRVTAATWAFQAQGGGDLPSGADLESAGAEILRGQGVGIQAVNTYRGIAGQWRGAKQVLHGLDDDEQIPAAAIFSPPWATTSSGAVPNRYRIRVEWEFNPDIGDSYTQWSNYELTGPLTSVADALAQAAQMKGRNPKSDDPGGAQGPYVNDYELEQI
jgi:hypothetical protein